jgi:sugar phosphate isomerase/epimerase
LAELAESALTAYPFRLGTTSYILPDDILPNARYLAGKVRDVELVLFEVDDGPNNLPSAEVVAELASLAQTADLTYTVHLPLDLRLSAEGDTTHASMLKARRVIECTLGLDPWAYVLHLDGREIKHGAAEAIVSRWQDQTVRALEIVAGWAGGAEKLVVENLETYPLDFVLPVIERVPVARCVDIGHLWLDGHDPVPYLEEALPRTRVIHLHGLSERDHKSLAHMPSEKLSPVVAALSRSGYAGVLTLEVFGQDDFETSMAALAAAWQAVQETAP